MFFDIFITDFFVFLNYRQERTNIIMKNLNDYIDEVQNQIDYVFKNKDLLFQAFTRKSWSHENGGKNNEELEFIGNTVLDFVVMKSLTEWFGDMTSNLKNWNKEEDADEFYFVGENEGTLTVLKSKLVDKEMLARRIDALGFKDYLFMGNGDIKNHKENEPSVKEDLFEAILGAVAIDSNWDVEAMIDVVNAMLNIDYYIENGFDEDENDYVALIQEWCQKNNGYIPCYSYQEYSDYFHANLLLDTPRGKMRYCGEGNSKMNARMFAAESAYEDLKSNDELWTILDELPDEITLENSINVLQELAQKGYQDYPEYEYSDEPEYDDEGNQRWLCHCSVVTKDRTINWTGRSSSKKIAKKVAAYSCLCDEFNLENEFDN